MDFRCQCLALTARVYSFNILEEVVETFQFVCPINSCAELASPVTRYFSILDLGALNRFRNSFLDFIQHTLTG
jgi:hypothetical protein